jgi:release factor glutamine methyltransferase
MPPPTPAADSDLSLAAITGRLRAAGCVFAEQEAAILTDSAPTPDALRFMIGQRAGGLPLEHVVGWASFCGLRVAVDHGVFVPRRRSELLVRLAARLAASCSVVVDLACGCGAIGAAIAALVSGVELHACDIDQAAVRCARRNLEPLGGRVYQGDLYQPLPDSLRHRVAVIAANVPYVPTDEVVLMPAEARVHEPVAALDGGRDGLDVLRRAAAGAAEWLAPGGHLLVEASARQAAIAAKVVAAAGLEPAVATDEDLGATVVVGRRPSATPGMRR